MFFALLVFFILRASGFDQGDIARALHQISGGAGQHGLGFSGDQELELRKDPSAQHADGDQKQHGVGHARVQAVHPRNIDTDADRDGEHFRKDGQQLAGKIAVRGHPADQGFAAVTVIAALAGVHDLAPQLGAQPQIDLFRGQRTKEHIACRAEAQRAVAKHVADQILCRHIALSVHHIAGKDADVHAREGGAEGARQDQRQEQPRLFDAFQCPDIIPQGRFFRLLLFRCLRHRAITS